MKTVTRIDDGKKIVNKELIAQELQHGEEFSFLRVQVSQEVVDHNSGLTLRFKVPALISTFRIGGQRMKVEREFLDKPNEPGYILVISHDLSFRLYLEHDTKLSIEEIGEASDVTRTLYVRLDAVVEKR